MPFISSQGGHLNTFLAQEWGICRFQTKKWLTAGAGRGIDWAISISPRPGGNSLRELQEISVKIKETREQPDVPGDTYFFLQNWPHFFLFICSFVVFFS